MFFIFIFSLSSVLGTVSITLRMSMLAETVRFSDFSELRPSCVCFFKVVRDVVVECFGSDTYGER